MRIVNITGRSLDVDDRDLLSRHLWLLREQMEQVVCALEVQQLVLLHQRIRWLPMVSENVENIIDDIRRTEAERISVSRRVSRALSLHDDASLAELASAADEPYASTWSSARSQLIKLHEEMAELASENRELTRRGATATSEVLRTLGGDLAEGHDTYDPTGHVDRLASPVKRFDRTA